MWKAPTAVSNGIPEPQLVLTGCRPLVPYHGVPGDTPGDSYPPFHFPTEHASKLDARTPRNFPKDDCPVCHGRIGANPDTPTDGIAHRTYCEFCGSLSPRNEARAARQRCEVDHRERTAAAQAKAEKAMDAATTQFRGNSVKLTECERRRIWNGYKGGILKESDGAIPNLAKTGRDFLREIGQVPDWTIQLDHRGNPIEPEPLP
jgi:hypothetical protein